MTDYEQQQVFQMASSAVDWLRRAQERLQHTTDAACKQADGDVREARYLAEQIRELTRAID
jgi:hypothetical protein